MLPQLTADAVAALHFTCKAFHRLLNQAPVSAMQPVLVCLLPPELRACATTSASMQSLLEAQVAFLRCMQPGVAVTLQRMSLSGDSAWELRWAPE